MSGLSLKIIGKWLISDELWEQFRPLIPIAPSPPSWHGGRPQISDRDAMIGIFFVLKTGCQWRALDATAICSGATAHQRFQEWTSCGVFAKFLESGP